MAHRLSQEAAAELDDIWYYVAKETRSVARANRFTDALTDIAAFLRGDE